jgi:hypothetical protein
VNCTLLLVDNTSIIKLDKNPRVHDKTKNINTKYHLIRYHVKAKTIHFIHCSTNEKIKKKFTKALQREKIEKLRMMLRLSHTPLD